MYKLLLETGSINQPFDINDIVQDKLLASTEKE